MAYRKIPLSEKIKIFIYIFSIINKTEIAKKFGIDPSTLIDLIEKKVIPALKIILVNKKPGPKSSDDQIEFNFDEQSGTSKWQDERPASCPHCGSSKVWKICFELANAFITDQNKLFKRKNTTIYLW
jgi:hypothetical protein